MGLEARLVQEEELAGRLMYELGYASGGFY